MTFGRFFQAVLWCLAGALLLAACAAGGSPSGMRTPHPRASSAAGERTQLIGIWFKGLSLVTEHETEVVGLVLTTPVAPDAADADAMTELLATAPIVATFRSAREAWAVGADLTRNAPVELVWCIATYGQGWSFNRCAPPKLDALPYPEHNSIPIGDPDSGIGQGTTFLTVLPPPLQHRGVAVSRLEGKANAMPAVWPRDQSLTVFTSWADMETRLGPVLIDGELVTWRSRGFEYWSADRLKRQAWKDRDRLKAKASCSIHPEGP